jgi:hypothetical protein
MPYHVAMGAPVASGETISIEIEQPDTGERRDLDQRAGRCWMMTLAGEPRAATLLLGQLAQTEFRDRPLWIAARDAADQPVVHGLAEVVAAQRPQDGQAGAHT